MGSQVTSREFTDSLEQHVIHQISFFSWFLILGIGKTILPIIKSLFHNMN